MNRFACRAALAAAVSLALSLAAGSARADSPYAAAAPTEAFVGPAETAPDAGCTTPLAAEAWLAAARPEAFPNDPCAGNGEVPVYTNADLEPFAVPEVDGPGEPSSSIEGGRGWDYVKRVLDRSYERLDADRHYRLDERVAREAIEDAAPDPWAGRPVLAPRLWWAPCLGCFEPPRRHRRPRHEQRPPPDGRDAVPVRHTPPHDRTPIASPTPAVGVSGGSRGARSSSRPSAGARHARFARPGSRSGRGADAVPQRSTPPHRPQPAQRPRPSRGRSGGN